MPESELMADLMTHDSTGAHEEVLLGVWILDAIPRRVKALEGKAADACRVACPPEAEEPLWARVKVLHCDGEARVGVSWSVIGKFVKNSFLPAATVLLVSQERFS